MNNPVFILSLFLLICSANLYSFSAVDRIKNLDNKVTMIQERQEQLIQLIDNNNKVSLIQEQQEQIIQLINNND